MAGDWLKFEKATPDKPEVFAISASLGLDPDAVVGKLIRVWSWFDTHTTDGNGRSVTPSLLDRISGVTGFVSAMAAVGWIVIDNDGVTLPNFDRHTGETAKGRALTAKRVANYKVKGNAKTNAVSVTSALPREEKRREEEKKELAAEVLIPLDDGTDHEVTLADLTEYRAAYPRIDPLAECRKARAWCLGNASNRKTRRGVGKFLNGWMARAQKDAESRPVAAAPKPAKTRQAL